MTTTEETSINELQNEIKKIKESLTQLNDQKEKFFSDRSDLSKKISQHINQIKKLKEERNTLTDKVKATKDERTEKTKQLKEKIIKHKELMSKRKDSGKKGFREDPVKIRKTIDRLQYSIETEVVDFKKEQKIMKQINELKKKLGAGGAYEESEKLGKEIAVLKKETDKLHEIIQKDAQTSQEKHEEMLKLSKEVDEFRKQEEEINKKIDEKKKEIKEGQNPLEDRLKQLSILAPELKQERKARKEKEEKRQQKKLGERQKDVQEKLKSGGKLTTEDFLVLQTIESPDDSEDFGEEADSEKKE